MIDTLNARTGSSVTIHDYAAWLGDGEDWGDAEKGNYDAFHAAAMKACGVRALERAESLARADSLLWYRIGGAPRMCGGIDLSTL